MIEFLLIHDQMSSDDMIRLVVSRTNTRVIAQVVRRRDKQDATLCSADSRELEKYGVLAGFANAPAGFLTGVLVAKRFRLLGVDGDIAIDFGRNKTDGRVVTGVIRGAVIGGMLPGPELTQDEVEIYQGKPIADYMRLLRGDEQRYRRQFGRFSELGIEPDGLRGMYEGAFHAICERPEPGERKSREYYKEQARARRGHVGDH